MSADLYRLFWVLLAYVLAFGVLPWFVLPRPPSARSRLDVLAINFVRWVAFVIVLTHVLAALKLYSWLGLLVSFLVVAWFGRYRRSFGGWSGLLHRVWRTDVPAVSPAPDGTLRAPERTRPPWRRLAALAGLVLPVLGVFGVSFWLRLQPALQYLSLSPPDAYVHMSWAQAFQDNVLWPDGVYPLGLASLISLVDVLAPMVDLVHVARFMGPIVGMTLVFAIYYAVVRLTRNPGAALLAAGTIGLFGTRPEWREPWHRLIGLVPQEFGVALAILGMTFAILAVTERGAGARVAVPKAGLIPRGGHPFTVMLASFAAAMTHPVPGAFILALVGVGAGTAALVTREGGISRAFGVGVGALTGVVVGFGVVPFAQFLGFPAYLDYGAGEAAADVASGSTTEDLVEAFGDLAILGHNPMSIIAVVCVLLGLVAALTLFLMRRDRLLTAQLLALTAAAGLLVALYDLNPFATYLDSFYLVRLANLVGAALALAFGVGLAWLGAVLARGRALGGVTIMVVLGALALAAFGWRFPAVAGDEGTREQLVYEQAVEVLLDIKQKYGRGTYTVVGTPAEAQVLAGDGFFVALWVFARDIPTVAPGDVIPIPTATTFLFVEKEPYPVKEVESVGGPTEEYYFVRETRGRIMAEVYDWAQSYGAAHTQLDVHYEDDQLVVYALRRNPAIAVDEDAPQFKDYTWRPGELFTEGPTEPALDPTS